MPSTRWISGSIGASKYGKVGQGGRVQGEERTSTRTVRLRVSDAQHAGHVVNGHRPPIWSGTGDPRPGAGGVHELLPGTICRVTCGHQAELRGLHPGELDPRVRVWGWGGRVIKPKKQTQFK